MPQVLLFDLKTDATIWKLVTYMIHKCKSRSLKMMFEFCENGMIRFEIRVPGIVDCLSKHSRKRKNTFHTLRYKKQTHVLRNPPSENNEYLAQHFSQKT